MNKELFQIQNVNLDGEAKLSVNARELHEFLEVKSRYNDWFKNRVSEYEFMQHVDYESVTKNLVSGGKQIEHFISLDMAKELSMVERNKKGKEARQYFIACEKKSKGLLIPQTLPEALRLAADLAEQNKILIPKANALDRLTDTDGFMNLTDAAKHLQMRRCDLTKGLSALRWAYKRAGGRSWIAYQDKLQQGLLIHKAYIKTIEGEPDKIYEQVLVTAKGLARLALLKEQGLI